MASVQISPRPLTVSRQRASGILLKKWRTRFGHQLPPMPQVACLAFTTPFALFKLIVAHRRPKFTHAVQIIDRNLITGPSCNQI
jgi:hypothetical protein